MGQFVFCLQHNSISFFPVSESLSIWIPKGLSFLVYIDVFWLHILWFKHTWSKCFPWIDQNISLRLSVFPKNHSLFSPFYEHTLTVFEKLQQGNNGSWIKKILLLKDLIKSRKSGPKNKATKMSKMAEDISCHHVFSSG